MYDEESGKVLLKADYIQTGYGDTLDASVRTVCFTSCVSHVTHSFNTTQELKQLKPVLADHLHACSPLVNDVRGSLVMAIRGECPFTEKSRHAENAGASVVMIFNTEPGLPIVPGGSEKRSVTSMVVTERTRRRDETFGCDAGRVNIITSCSVRTGFTHRCALERFEQVPGRKEVALREFGAETNLSQALLGASS